MTRTWGLLVCLSLVGCAGVDLQPLAIPEALTERAAATPTHVIPVWTDTILHKDGTAIRGFGGRVMFYGEERDKSLQVDGVVIVYAWNDTGDARKETPDRKYVFRASELSRHYSRSKVGHSYSFWLPWDEVGGETQHVTLVTRFIDAAGGEVTSSAAHVVLPGPYVEPTNDHDAKAAKRGAETSQWFRSEPGPDEPIQQLSFEADSNPIDHSERGSAAEPTTIRLPLHLAVGDSEPLDILDLTTRSAAAARESSFPEETAGSSVAAELERRSAPDGHPARSRQSSRRFAARDRTRRFRSEPPRHHFRQRQSDSLTVSQRIARDAAEARSRRERASSSPPVEE